MTVGMMLSSSMLMVSLCLCMLTGSSVSHLGLRFGKLELPGRTAAAAYAVRRGFHLIASESKKQMTEKLRLMCVLAHPDDESLGNGGALAKYAAEGIETYLVTATR